MGADCYRCRNSYESLTDSQKPEILEVLGKIPCALTGNLISKPSEVIVRDTFFCQTCDDDQQQQFLSAKDPDGFEALWEIMNFILPKLTRIPGPRIAAMVSLRRILMHSSSLNQMHLSSSAPGEFCLHSLRSSIRELRVATGYVLDDMRLRIKLTSI